MEVECGESAGSLRMEENLKAGTMQRNRTGNKRRQELGGKKNWEERGIGNQSLLIPGMRSGNYPMDTNSKTFYSPDTFFLFQKTKIITKTLYLSKRRKNRKEKT